MVKTLFSVLLLSVLAMGQASLAPVAKQQFFDKNGKPLNGGMIYTYESGTTIPLATYTDSTGNTPAANPIVLDSGGWASIWIGSGTYRFEISDSKGVVLYTVDGITAATGGGAGNIASLTGDATGISVSGAATISGTFCADDVQYNVKCHGAKGDARLVTVVATNSSTTVTSSAQFLSTDVGKKMWLSDGTHYEQVTITAYASTSSVTVSPAANYTGTSASTYIGTQDDSTAIQATIDAAAGKPIRMPAGTYFLLHPLHYRTHGDVAGFKIAGDGAGDLAQTVTKIVIGGGFSCSTSDWMGWDHKRSIPVCAALDVQGVPDLTAISQFQKRGYIRHLEITAQSTSLPATAVDGISLEGIWYFDVSNNNIHGLSGDGIIVPQRYDLASDWDWWATVDSTFDKNSISGNVGGGINTRANGGFSGNTISNSVISSNGGTGLYNSGWDNKVIGNSFSGNGCYLVAGACTNALPGYGLLVRSGDTLYGGGLTSGRVEGNEFDGNEAGHIYIGASVSSVVGLVMGGNQFKSHTTVMPPLGFNVPNQSIVMAGSINTTLGPGNLSRSDSNGAVAGFSPSGAIANPNMDTEVAGVNMYSASGFYAYQNWMYQFGEYNNSANLQFLSQGGGAVATSPIVSGSVPAVTMVRYGLGYVPSPVPTLILAGGDSPTVAAAATITVNGTTGAVTGCTITNPTTNGPYTNTPLGGIFSISGAGSGAVITAGAPSGGHVTTCSISSAGTGYKTSDYVTFSPQCAVQPTGTVNVSNEILDLDISNGGNGGAFTVGGTPPTPPTITITDGTGSGAQFYADIAPVNIGTNLSPNVVWQVVSAHVNSPTGYGHDYSSSPTVSFSDLTGAWTSLPTATAGAAIARGITSVTVTNSGSGCIGTVYPIFVNQPYTSSNASFNTATDRGTTLTQPATAGATNIGTLHVDNFQIDSTHSDTQSTMMFRDAANVLGVEGGNDSSGGAGNTTTGLTMRLYKSRTSSGTSGAYQRLGLNVSSSTTLNILTETDASSANQNLEIGTAGTGTGTNYNVLFKVNGSDVAQITSSAIISQVAGAMHLGIGNNPFADLTIGSSSTAYGKLTGTFTGARVFTFPDTSATVAVVGTANSGNLLATGIIDGQVPITKVTAATFTFGTTYSTGYYLNQNATAATAITGTLGTATAGEQYCVTNSYNGTAADTGTITIQTSAAGQYLISGGTQSLSGGYIISGGAAGDSACVVGIDATHWQVYTSAGTWTLH